MLAFIEPCLPSPADRPPSGPDWIHEIKLDGFRMMVRRDPAGVRLLTRNGYDWTGRFPLIAAAAETLRARSFLIDGEAVACDGDGLPVFDRLRYRRQDGRVFLYAFDLLELNGRDMRREPLEVRKSALAGVLRRMKAWAGIQLNEHCDDLPVDVVFRHACKLGFEGIVSKRVGSPYRSGRSRDWLKTEKSERTRSEARGGGGLGPRPMGAGGQGNFSIVGNTITLETIGGGQPSQMILPTAGNYPNANASITNGMFSPFVDGTAQFTLFLSGVNINTTVTSATFSFGTGPDTFHFYLCPAPS